MARFSAEQVDAAEGGSIYEPVLAGTRPMDTTWCQISLFGMLVASFLAAGAALYFRPFVTPLQYVVLVCTTILNFTAVVASRMDPGNAVASISSILKGGTEQ